MASFLVTVDDDEVDVAVFVNWLRSVVAPAQSRVDFLSMRDLAIISAALRAYSYKNDTSRSAMMRRFGTEADTVRVDRTLARVDRILDLLDQILPEEDVAEA